MIPIVEFLRLRATARGIPSLEIDDLWTQHVGWCDAQGVEYGGRGWDSLLDSVVRRLKDAKALDQKTAEWAEVNARKHAAELRAKAAEDAEYDRVKMGLGTWLASLRAQVDAGETLSPVEHALAVESRAHVAGDDPCWIADTLSRARRFDGAPSPRENACPEPGCGLPVSSWRSPSGWVQRGSRCVDHEAQAVRRRP